MSAQKDIACYLENPKNPSKKWNLEKIIGAKCMTHKQLPLALNLLECYGVVHRKRKNNSVYIFEAANLSLKDILEHQSQWSDNTESIEAHFLCKGIFYIDASLYYSRCKIKSVAIIASKVIITQEEREIDVSGSDGKSFDAHSRAKDGEVSSDYGPGAHGDNGKHGNPGESGGNIMICADEIENSELLILCSRGGNGGNGQHGGNGQDGKAMPSKSDDLIKFGGYEKLSLVRADYSKEFRSYHTHDIKPCFPSRSCYAYAKSEEGVEILYGRYLKGTAGSYAFLYSKGVNGVSADGGNAGRGGRAGGGGKGGHIDILMKNHQDHNLDHNITVISCDGRNGIAGRPGNPGKRDLAESRRDYLVVDGCMKPILRYDGFIEVLSYSGEDNSRLDRGWYYCDSEIVKWYSTNLTEKIEFFKHTRSPYCPTTNNQQAEDGKSQQQQEDVIHSTPTKPIQIDDTMNDEIFVDELTNKFSLIHFLEKMQQTIHKELSELETVDTKQQYKKMLKSNDFSIAAHSVFPVAVDMKYVLNEVMDGSLVQRIAAAVARLDDQFDINKFKASSVKVKYLMLENFIEEQVSKLKFQDERECKLVNELAVFLFHSTFLIHNDRSKSLQRTSEILRKLKYLSSPFPDAKVRNKLTNMKHNVELRIQWSILAVAHKELVNICTFSDKLFQQKAVNLYIELCLQTSYGISFIKYLIENLAPFTGNLKEFQVSCSSNLFLHSEVKLALEILMLYINEANERQFYFPNVLEAVEREYEAYCITISNYDLMFIMTYIQEKLSHLLIDKKRLESLFCKKLLMALDELRFYMGGFIIYRDNAYRIEAVDENCIILSSNNIMNVNLENFSVSLNEHIICFPESLLISRLNIIEVWKIIEGILLKNKLVNDISLETVQKFFSFLESEDQYKLYLLLQQAYLAQDIPFDVFSFYPPSHWIEKLIYFSVMKLYGDHDANFVAEVELKIDGLSECHDKSLYCNLFMQYLRETSKESGSFKIDLLEVLEKMRLIYIEQKLSFLVSEHGLAQAGIKNFATIYSDLASDGYIDCTGFFNMIEVTKSKVEMFCKNKNIDALFLTTIFNMQKYISQLTGQGLPLWINKLRELHLQFLLQQLMHDNALHERFLVYIYQMQSNYGENEVLNFLKLLCDHCQKINFTSSELLDLFSKCSRQEWTLSIVLSSICGVQVNSSTSSFLENLNLFDWESHRNRERTASEICEYIKSNHPPLLKDAEFFFTALNAVEGTVGRIESHGNSQSLFHNSELTINKYSKQDINEWVKEFRTRYFEPFQKSSTSIPIQRSSTSMPIEIFQRVSASILIEMFAVICRGITLFYAAEKSTEKVTPRNNQLVASLLFLHNLSAQGGEQSTKLLQQISTGEGKTMILCIVGIYKVLFGEKVDIVTSSSVLATRDASDLCPLYKMFNITVSHCCHEEITKRRKADIVYGDIGSFQRDILETEFYDRDIQTDRDFNTVFVDEVDSMLVDKGQNMLYLPHAIPDMNCLDILYLEIWSWVNSDGFIGLEHEKELLYGVLRQKFFGEIVPGVFSAIHGIDERRSKDIFEYLVKKKIINNTDYCLTESDYTALKKCVESFESDKYTRNEIICTIQQYIKEKPLIEKIPKSLHTFVRKSLKSWINSAIYAKHFCPNKEYIIDVDHRESANDHYPKVVIMDNETGVEQESSEWGNGLHQFLQLKHNLRLSTESLKAVFMSNISFFRKYKNIMGVTGTLGSMAEHYLFKRLYDDILIVKLPTNKPSRLIFEQHMCYSSETKWEEAIYQDVYEKLQSNRAALLICEDVERARHLQQLFASKNEKMHPKLYCSSHQEKLENTAAIEPGLPFFI